MQIFSHRKSFFVFSSLQMPNTSIRFPQFVLDVGIHVVVIVILLSGDVFCRQRVYNAEYSRYYYDCCLSVFIDLDELLAYFCFRRCFLSSSSAIYWLVIYLFIVIRYIFTSIFVHVIFYWYHLLAAFVVVIVVDAVCARETVCFDNTRFRV